jgi:hypothetical protein
MSRKGNCWDNAEWIYFHIYPQANDGYREESPLNEQSDRIVLAQLIDVRENFSLIRSLFEDVMRTNASQQTLHQ